MMLLVALLAGVVLVALVIYVIREAATLNTEAAILKTATSDLKTQLDDFKTRGFDELIKTKVEVLERTAMRHVAERETLLKQKGEELVRERQEHIRKIAEIHEGFGKIQAQVQELGQLRSEVGELNDLLKPQQLRGELGEVKIGRAH